MGGIVRVAIPHARPGPFVLEVRISKLDKSFDGRVVLRGASVGLPAGKLVALLGESGAGKTTMIRCVAGIERPEGGTIRIGDRTLFGGGADVPPEERGVGVVFQDLALFPHLRAWENVAFPLEGRLPRSRRRDRAGAWLRRVGLEGGHDRRPAELSGGERRRVALARALAGEPRVLLLDEPFSDLPRGMREDLLDLVREVGQREGVAMLHATHIQGEALAFADLVAILHDGVVVQQAPPDEVYRRPASAAAARLLGPVGIVRGEPAGPDARTLRTALGPVPANGSGGEVLIAIRPEAIEVREDGPGEGSVIRRIFEGGRTILEVEVAGERVWATGDAGISPGDVVRLRIDPSRVHVLPGEGAGTVPQAEAAGPRDR